MGDMSYEGINPSQGALAVAATSAPPSVFEVQILMGLYMMGPVLFSYLKTLPLLKTQLWRKSIHLLSRSLQDLLLKYLSGLRLVKLELM